MRKRLSLLFLMALAMLVVTACSSPETASESAVPVATEAEAEAYVNWAIQVAEQVALAAKEGGFLGVGGERVSAQEMTALDAIREALGAC